MEEVILSVAYELKMSQSFCTSVAYSSLGITTLVRKSRVAGGTGVMAGFNKVWSSMHYIQHTYKTQHCKDMRDECTSICM